MGPLSKLGPHPNFSKEVRRIYSYLEDRFDILKYFLHFFSKIHSLIMSYLLTGLGYKGTLFTSLALEKIYL